MCIQSKNTMLNNKLKYYINIISYINNTIK